MSKFANCRLCQGYGRKVTPEGGFILCWGCGGSRHIHAHEIDRKAELSRYDQNIHWKAMLLDRSELWQWTLQKRISHLLRKGFNSFVGQTVSQNTIDDLMEQMGRSIPAVVDQLGTRFALQAFGVADAESLYSNPYTLVAAGPPRLASQPDKNLDIFDVCKLGIPPWEGEYDHDNKLPGKSKKKEET